MIYKLIVSCILVKFYSMQALNNLSFNKTKLMSVYVCAFLASCGEVPKPSHVMAEVGTNAIIKRHGQELILDVTDVTGNILSTEISWNGELVASRQYYRGLYPMSGIEYGYQFEMDFDETALEQLFPLKVGKEVSFNGNLKIIDNGTALDAWVHLQVVAEKSMKITSGTYTVFVVEVISEFSKDDRSERKSNIIYYAPDLGMILKFVNHQNGQQSFWRVVSIDSPDKSSRIKPVKKQNIRSGTVMI